MTTKELMVAEIERLRKDIRGYDDWTLGFESACERILNTIDTLPDEPVTDCHDLEEEISTWIPAHISGGDNGVWRDTKNAVTEWAGMVARHFAEWQKAKILKDNPVIMPVENFQALIDSHAKRVEADYKEKILKEAIEGFIFQSEDYYPKELIARYNGELKHGDKVKIIIVKEEE